MGGRRTNKPIVKHQLRLYAGDFEAVEKIVAGTALSATEFIRELVHKTIIKIQNRAAERNVEVEIDDPESGATLF